MTPEEATRLSRVETKIDIALDNLGCLVKLVKGGPGHEGLVTKVAVLEVIEKDQKQQKRLVWGAILAAALALGVSFLEKVF